MARGHGGARRNAGRKKSEGQVLLRQAMDGVIGTQDWQRMLQRVMAKIEKSGDANALYRLAAMRFGLPAQSDEPKSDPEPLEIRTVIVHLPRRDDKDPNQLTPAADEEASQPPPADIAPDLTEPADNDDDDVSHPADRESQQAWDGRLAERLLGTNQLPPQPTSRWVRD